MTDHPQNFYDLNRTKGLKIVHLNVRSLIPKIEQLKLIFAHSNIDILTVSETWLKPTINTQVVDIPGYTCRRLDRDSNRSDKTRGGGLATYIKNSLAADVKSLATHSHSDNQLEVQWLEIGRERARNLLIANVYRPPQGDVKKAMKTLDTTIKNIHTPRKELFILGDFNIDYKNTGSAKYRELLFLQKANNLKQHIKTTTRNTDKKRTLLDLVLTQAKYIKSAGTLDSFISDHQPIYIIKKKQREIWKPEKFEGRTYKNYDYAKFKEGLISRNWGEYFNNEDVEGKWQNLLNVIKEELDKLCPIKEHKISKMRPPYLTLELGDQMRERDYFYSKAKRTRDEDDWNIAKYLRNRVKSNIRVAKANYIKEQLNANENNPLKFWRTIRDVFPADKNKNKLPVKLQGPQGVIEDDKIPDYINDFFINVGTNPHSKMTNRNSNNNRNTVNPGLNFELEEVTQNTIDTLLRQINVAKSSGVDNIKARVLKDALEILSHHICILMNGSIKAQIFPQSLKEATVIPIPKKGDVSQVSNYRPISLLPMPSKVLEKVVHQQLSDHIEEENLLSEFQHGFRKNHSTAQAITELVTGINHSLDNRGKTVALFIDFRKAFDCVQFLVLINKLRKAGLGTKTIKWVESYLHNRKQRTRVNGLTSSKKTITQGVPQGSILGPLFYILYANDIAKVVHKNKVVFYADDTVIYSSGKNVKKLVAKIQKDLDNLVKWCRQNGLYINSDKTKYMIFSNKSLDASTIGKALKIDKVRIELVTTYCYLGIVLDEQMTYEAHVNKLVGRVAAKIAQMKRIRQYITEKAALLIYKNAILPIMEYGDI